MCGFLMGAHSEREQLNAYLSLRRAQRGGTALAEYVYVCSNRLAGLVAEI